MVIKSQYEDITNIHFYHFLSKRKIMLRNVSIYQSIKELKDTIFMLYPELIQKRASMRFIYKNQYLRGHQTLKDVDYKYNDRDYMEIKEDMIIGVTFFFFLQMILRANVKVYTTK